MKVLMIPHLNHLSSHQNGIARVVEAYFRYLPRYDIELVPGKEGSYDLKAVHAGTAPDCDVAHTHGLYWTADYLADAWEWKANSTVVNTVRQAEIITVPSEWVAETFRRDMRVNPVIIPHGIEWDLWQGIEPSETGHILWNKNRTGDVCDPTPARDLAVAFPQHHFVSTFAPPDHPENLTEIGVIPHVEMKRLIAGAALYLSTTKETFGIGTLEAMACGIPVLGYAHGGNLDLVQHGVNGYLARPGNFEDLKQGFAYCFKYRKILGANGRELARRWTWDQTARKVAEVYRDAYAKKNAPASVAIIIPCYNYSEKVGRAIESAINQTYEELTDIIVVDDGSDDSEQTYKVCSEFSARDDRVRLAWQKNAGVAAARNRGIREAASAKYVCCLDADDALDPRFIEVCVDELEKDRKLGIAFTGLRWIKPDGSTGISQWPGPSDFDRQLRRQNQIPTCCVFRREMWERLGGYKNRYAPDGAGSEDAEFWTRAGAYGWGAKKATDAGLFIYSWQSGRVSGRKDYSEVDWLAWHPWSRDDKHPFASYASPTRFSHPVRQYDEPLVSVIIPVGPGHNEMVVDALDSLEAQTFRHWEVIVVWDQMELPDPWMRKAYPYVRWRYLGALAEIAGKDPPFGSGFARNFGVKTARAPFLLFLDADDWLYPEAMELMLEAWKEEEAIIYTDYVGKAHVGDPSKLAENLQQRIYQFKNGEAVIGYSAADFDPELAQQQPKGERPYLWANVTALIPRAWHHEIGGFDENMPSWEDVDYHYRMARAGKCYVRIPQELMVYRFSTGMRRQSGLQTYQTLVEYLKQKYQEIETVVCNCPSPPTSNPSLPTPTMARMKGNGRPQSQGGSTMARDEDMVLARYKHPNRGQHTVVGPATKIKYGFRAGGDVFLVHKDDVRTQPHLFEEVEKATPPEVPRPPAPPPEAVEPPPSVITGLMGELPAEAAAAEIPAPEVIEAPKTHIVVGRLPGVTAPIAEQLDADGIQTAQQVLDLGVEGLMKYKGIGKIKAEAMIGAIEELMKVASEA